MNNEKLEALKLAGISSAIIFIGVFALSYGVDWMSHQGLRTYEQCNQLTGLLKDDKTLDPDYFKVYPNRINQTSKDNCLEGLHILDSGILVLRYVMSPGFSLMVFVMIYRIFGPEKKPVNTPSKEESKHE